MTAPEPPSQRLLEIALTAEQRHYSELWEQWRALDTKAQAAGAVAGVLLAGLFAFVRESLPVGYRLWLLALAVLLALGSAFFAVLVLRIREVESPPFGEKVGALVDHLLEAASEGEEELAERIPAFLEDQRRLWRKANASNEKALEDKAAWLVRAQWILLGAVTIVAALVLVRLFAL